MKNRYKIPVSYYALEEVLRALTGPSHLIRELQATRDLPEEFSDRKNPIDELLDDFGEAQEALIASQQKEFIKGE